MPRIDHYTAAEQLLVDADRLLRRADRDTAHERAVLCVAASLTRAVLAVVDELRTTRRQRCTHPFLEPLDESRVECCACGDELPLPKPPEPKPQSDPGGGT